MKSNKNKWGNVQYNAFNILNEQNGSLKGIILRRPEAKSLKLNEKSLISQIIYNNRMKLLAAVILAFLCGFNYTCYGQLPNGTWFCHDGLCIPDSDDPNHPKFHLDKPITPLKSIDSNDSTDRQIHSLKPATSVQSTDNELEATDRWIIPLPCGNVYKSNLYGISPDGDLSICLESDFQDHNCGIKGSDYYRDHWTVTCWRTFDFGPGETCYKCHNWNTVWGDWWHVYFTALTEPK